MEEGTIKNVLTPRQCNACMTGDSTKLAVKGILINSPV